VTRTRPKNLNIDAPLPSLPTTVASLPAAASYTGSTIYVTDETGGSIPAFSDGTNWRRVSDNTIVS
jgi:hypothetical protein